VRLRLKSICESICLGAVYGVVAWTAYAVVECWFSSILPWIIQPNQPFQQLNLGFTALLFGLYAAIGLISGGLAGLGLRMVAGRISWLDKTPPAIVLLAAATVSVIFAFVVNLLVRFQVGTSIVGLLSLSLLLTLGLVLSVGSTMWSRRLRFLTNPWSVCLVLVGLSWMTFEVLENESWTLKAGSTLAYLVGVLFIAFLVDRVGRGRGTARITSGIPTSPTKTLGFLAAVVFVILGVSYWLNQAPGLVTVDLKPSSVGTGHPNVLLITMDTVRADHLSLYGYERNTTPNLDKLSEEAAVYTHAIASGDMTLSSHASIFTGMYARQHGAHFDPPKHPSGRPLANKFHTLAEILSENGYVTMAVVANYGFLGQAFLLDQGFQYYDHRIAIPFLQSTPNVYIRESIQKVFRRFASRSAYEKWSRSAEEINREVFSLLNRLTQGGGIPFVAV